MNRQNKACEREGNTKPLSQPTRKTFYCFTVFNLNDESEIEFNRQLGNLCVKYLYGKEICPTTGRIHFQGFMHLKKAMRITELKLIGKPHLEACKGTEEQNEKYCSKDGNVVKWGYPKPLPNVNAIAMHLQWIKNHPNYIPVGGNGPPDRNGKITNHFETMSLFYGFQATHPLIIPTAERWLRDDIRDHASMKKAMASFEHDALY